MNYLEHWGLERKQLPNGRSGSAFGRPCLLPPSSIDELRPAFSESSSHLVLLLKNSHWLAEANDDGCIGCQVREGGGAAQLVRFINPSQHFQEEYLLTYNLACQCCKAF